MSFYQNTSKVGPDIVTINIKDPSNINPNAMSSKDIPKVNNMTNNSDDNDFNTSRAADPRYFLRGLGAGKLI